MDAYYATLYATIKTSCVIVAFKAIRYANKNLIASYLRLTQFIANERI